MTAALQPLESAQAPDRARRGGRAGKRAGGSAAFEQPAYRQLRNPLTPTKLVSEDELESIHLASLRVLREIGVDVLHDEARRIMKAHGALPGAMQSVPSSIQVVTPYNMPSLGLRAAFVRRGADTMP